MRVDIPPDLVGFVCTMIASGRCHNEGEVVSEALRLLEAVDRRHGQLRSEVLAGMNSGDSVPREAVGRQLQEWAMRLDTEHAANQE
ncbi:MAG TPA: type II toxin-antitoxin system ParD family antitoxin [Pirellulales bacterium]